MAGEHIVYPPSPAMTRSASVLAVHDGDTATFDLDLGYHVHLRQALRLFGINAPELSTPGGPDSKAALMALLPLGLAVVVLSWLDRSDKYGRILGRIVTPGGVDVNQRMVDDGQAVIWYGHGPKPTS